MNKLNFSAIAKAVRSTLVNKSTLITLASLLPIFIYWLPMLLSGTHTLFPGDFDMQIQMTEAARISIQGYGQFPWWNPWVSGGVPLFADPQFGLATPQTILSLFVGSVYAWKLTIFIYMIVGFLAMRALLLFVTKTKKLAIPTLLSYLWIFGSFFALRSAGGHFTFMVLALLPLAIYLLLHIQQSKKYVIYLTLLIAYAINAAVHYSTILMILTLGVIAAVMCALALTQYKKLSWKKFWASTQMIRLFALSVTLAALLTSIRLYTTLNYLHDNSTTRTDARESFIGIGEGLRSLFLPFGTYTSSSSLGYGQFEASNYIGTITAIVLLVAGLLFSYIIFRKRKNTSLAHYAPLIAIAILCIGTFLIGLGGPIFNILRELPVMSSMRVSTRFFFITALCIIILLAFFITRIEKEWSKKRFVSPVILTVLIVASVQVFIPSYDFQRQTWINNDSLLLVSPAETLSTSPPHTEINWIDQESKSGYYHALSAATKAHKTQAVADNALVDTRSLSTQRCDEDEAKCSFVLTQNAEVLSWSPNAITLKRTAPGEIRLNMNQCFGWRTNGARAFPFQHTLNSDSTFIIPNSDLQKYTLVYRGVL